LYRKCAAVLLHTPTNNVAACGLYSNLGFLRLRKHLSFYTIPTPSTAPNSQDTLALPPSRRPLPIYLDAYLFARSTQLQVDDRSLDSTDVCVDLKLPAQNLAHVHAAHSLQSVVHSKAQHNMRDHRCCTADTSFESASATSAGPSLQSMHQYAPDRGEHNSMMHSLHEYPDEPVLASTQLSFLADVGFSGALVRSTAAAGVVVARVSNWLGSSCSGASAYSAVASPPPSFTGNSWHGAWASQSGAHATTVTARAGRRAEVCSAQGIELSVRGGSGTSLSCVSDQGGATSPQALSPDHYQADATVCALAHPFDESSTATPNSETSTGVWPESHNRSSNSVHQSKSVLGFGRLQGTARAQRSVSASSDLTFYQRLFGRP
jgi:hypothetical protein